MHPHILITGEAGHGKDTIGEYLVKNHGYLRTAFADPLKKEIIDAYKNAPELIDMAFMNIRELKNTAVERFALKYCSDKDYVATVIKTFEAEDLVLAASQGRGVFTAEERLDQPRSMRRIAQTWGTEYRRSKVDSYWVDLAADFIEAANGKSEHQPVVICDGRFYNECDWAEKNGLKRIHVIRPGYLEITIKHASENQLSSSFNTVLIENTPSTGDLVFPNNLYKKIEDALDQFQSMPAKKAKVVPA